ncbi:MAG: 3-methyl-2-oxobutanoate hydroxymethyltransferase [Desulfurococcales archaeon]|nr:3-methyl-2-oxobutanoate hydroxymethyltransferase [Desulfurococcales archaeon]
MGGERRKVTPADFVKAKKRGHRIVMVTAYDYYQARMADEAGVDGILVGDSLGMVVMGFSSTIPVTVGMIAHHLRAVLNARPRCLVVADMPFMSYEISREEAVRNAGKLIKMGADAVKVEGLGEVVDKVEAMVRSGIPVMGHVGLNPQRSLVTGLRMRGKKAEEAIEIIEASKALEEAGAFSIVIEYTASEIAEEITRRLSIPTICIGSGPKCDGQILVFHDLVGLNPSPPPFAKQYLRAYQLMLEALTLYVKEVREGLFPGREMYWSMDPEELEKLKKALDKRKIE